MRFHRIDQRADVADVPASAAGIPRELGLLRPKIEPEFVLHVDHETVDFRGIRDGEHVAHLA